MEARRIELPEGIILENGSLLRNVEVSFHTYGNYKANLSKVVWVCHALTGNSDVFNWWSGLFGPNALYNPNEYFIICANILGSHYGTTSPLSTNPETDLPYFHDFPQFSIRDISRVHQKLADILGIAQIHTLIGGSLGGQQALEWAIMEPNRIEHLILLATNAKHSSWGVAFNTSQRWAIENDISWTERNQNAGMEGLKIARSIALLSYRNQKIYNSTQNSTKAAISYQRYQGEKLSKRFNAFSYWYLSHAMDNHDVSRNRAELSDVLDVIEAKTLIISVKNDLLFPKKEQQLLHQHIPYSFLVTIDSNYGHDGFLIETKKISQKILNFYRSDSKQYA